MGFLLHKFAHFAHDLHLFKALRLFFLTNFPGPTVIPCPTSIPDSRVNSVILGLIKIMNRADKNWAHNWVNKECTLKIKVFKNFH